VNVAGGLRIEEPSADLAVAAALASSLRERPIQSGTALAGELSLAGRIRPAARVERRLAEARRLGFARLVTGPAGRDGDRASDGAVHVPDIRTALREVLTAD
jgi:DNA repair protein RadA/Sms